MTIHVFGKVNSGSDADSLFVWKVPTLHRNSSQHVGLVAKTIDGCRKSLPKEVSKEAVRQFNTMMNGLTSLPAKARDALRNIIYLGDPNPDESLADEYVDFVMSVCAGEPIDETMLVDGRASNSVKQPIDIIAEKFAQLETSGRKVIVRPRVTVDKVEALHSQLAKIDPNYSSAIMTKEHLGKVPLINQFIDTHAVITPYHVDLAKCKNHACCVELKTPPAVQELALQRQPTPVNDPANKGHFYCRNDALKVFAGDTAALTNLSDLPSQNVEKTTTKAEKKKRDTAIAKLAGKNIWSANRVRCIVTCFNCTKRRCVYSPDDLRYREAATALKQKLESVSERYSCGDLLFDDSDPLSKVLVQKTNLTCESDIENGYYNDVSRALRLQDVCVHCGETEDTGSAGTFLLGQKQLEERCLTGGYKSRPICVVCLEMKRKIVTYGKKDESKAREEKMRARSR
eukprot:scaffold27229_cov124-Skeletonema_marinoi.AAC.1